MAALQHILFFKLQNYSLQDIEKLQNQVQIVQERVPGILFASFEAATFNIHYGHKNRTRGYTHNLVMIFKDGKSLEGYVPHEEHLNFKKLIKPFVAEPPICIDSYTNNFPKSKL